MSVQVKAEVTGVNGGGKKGDSEVWITSLNSHFQLLRTRHNSAVRILEDVIADSGIFDGFQIFCLFFLTPDTRLLTPQS